MQIAFIRCDGSCLASLGFLFQGVCSLISREFVPLHWFVYACTVDLLVSSYVLFFIYKISYIWSKKRNIQHCLSLACMEMNFECLIFHFMQSSTIILPLKFWALSVTIFSSAPYRQIKSRSMNLFTTFLVT
jgi:hypothetical protein